MQVLHLQQRLLQQVHQAVDVAVFRQGRHVEHKRVRPDGVGKADPIGYYLTVAPIVKIGMRQVAGAHPPALGAQQQRIGKERRGVLPLRHQHGQSQQVPVAPQAGGGAPQIQHVRVHGVPQGLSFVLRGGVVRVRGAAHARDEGGAMGRHGPCGLRPSVQEGAGLRGLVRARLLAEETRRGQLHGKLDVGIGGESHFFNGRGSVPLETLAP
mmetsp:Transcript_42389/g.83286  ORF Transcript_42389/g.83286 Transcript_42389/m.83286 type:complete len:211 (-) Transcript_42389:1526-2158(-)